MGGAAGSDCLFPNLQGMRKIIMTMLLSVNLHISYICSWLKAGRVSGNYGPIAACYFQISACVLYHLKKKNIEIISTRGVEHLVILQ